MTRKCECGAEYDFPCDERTAMFTPAVCPECVETMLAKKEKQIVHSVPDENKELEDRGIMPEHYGATIENWVSRTDYDEKVIRRACTSMVSARRGILVMLGNNGTGKTHLAAAMVKELGGRYFRMQRMAAWIRSGFNSGAGPNEYEALVYLGKIPLLVIDEAEKSKGTTAESNWFSDVLDDRYSRRKPTILISNFHPKATHQDGKYCERCFESILTPDILDRIDQIGAVLNFSGASYRRELRGK